MTPARGDDAHHPWGRGAAMPQRVQILWRVREPRRAARRPGVYGCGGGSGEADGIQTHRHGWDTPSP
ncbi:MAG TPA: hypothetical protein VED18_12525 [Candidatus Sulfotelmatobacter sp.]|nr:hypothetical protein [Candidatus Sulfotelmatobacter sp.]